jgi:hypothetical protein
MMPYDSNLQRLIDRRLFLLAGLSGLGGCSSLMFRGQSPEIETIAEEKFRGQSPEFETIA